MHRTAPLAAAFLLLAPLSGVGCDAEAPPTAAAPAAPASPAWLLAVAPDDAVGVADAKATAAEGDRLTLTGRVGGRAEPVSPEAGLFVLMDASVPSCADLPGDGCTTPWDYCCEPQDAIAANAATVQLRDAGGEPIALEPSRVSPLATVTATGTVGPRPNDGVLVLHADAIAVTP